MRSRGAHQLAAGFVIAHQIGEAEPHAIQRRDLHFNAEDIIVAGGHFVAELALDDRKNGVALLPHEERMTNEAEELAARSLKHVQIPGVVHMIAESAFGVRNAMVMNVGLRGHRKSLENARHVAKPADTPPSHDPHGRYGPSGTWQRHAAG